MLVSRKTILALILAVALLRGADSVSPQATGMCVGSQIDLYNGDVMTGGVVKAMETWDAKPYNSFAKWDTDVSANGNGVKFRVWLSDKATAGGVLQFSLE